MRPNKRLASPPSSIAGETDTSHRAKFRSLPPPPPPHRQPYVHHQDPYAAYGSYSATPQVFEGRGYTKIPSRRVPLPATGSLITDNGVQATMYSVTDEDYRRSIGQPEAGEYPADSASALIVPSEEGVTSTVEEKRILSLHSPSIGNLAAAWYDPETRRIEVLEDTKDTLSWDLAVLILEQVNPDAVIMSSRAHYTLVDQAKKWDEENREAGDERPSRITILTQKSCSYPLARSHLTTVKLPDHSSPALVATDAHSGTPSSPSTATGGASSYANQIWRDEGAGMGSHRLNLVKLGCWVNVDAPAAIIATGILVAEVKKGQAMLQGPGRRNGFGLELTSLDSMDLDRHMQINKDALTSLAIFSTEDHAFMHSDKQKEGLSVFGLLNSAVTPLGRKLLHTWHLRPLLSLKDIEDRHAAVALFSSGENRPRLTELKRKLKGIKNVPAICNKLRSGPGQYSDWRGLTDSLLAACDARDLVLSMPHYHTIEILEKIREVFSDDLPRFSHTVHQVVDWDDSQIHGRLSVNQGIDRNLDDLRESYAALDTVLDRVARKIAIQVPRGVSTDCTVHYLPQIGFHAILTTEETEAPVVPGWQPQFKNDDKYYYRTRETRELDEHYGDIVSLIRGREVEIMQAVIDRLHEVELRLYATMDVIAELDCLVALAAAAIEHDLCRPRMTDDKVLRIENGRHILYERTSAEPFIPNDTMLRGGDEGDFHSMMIITGANGSGKSAYGKQVALIVFMAQIGSFVPATEAIIGICDKIFTRLQTKESVAKNASAFMIDLSQVSQALRGATDRSLLILDEFGKGTVSWDGAGLLTGVIEYLLSTTCPRTIVLTHFHELFTQEILSESAQVLFAHMETTVEQGADKLYFLFKLVPTPCLTSYAAECALSHGVAKKIVNRARFVAECISTFQLSKLFDMTLNPTQIAEMKSAELLAKRFLSWKIDEEDSGLLDKLREMLEETKVDVDVKPESDDAFQGGTGTTATTSEEDMASISEELEDLMEVKDDDRDGNTSSEDDGEETD